MAIDANQLYHISFYEYGEAYFGSCSGMRYRVAREPLENVHFTPPDQRGEAVIAASIWPEPFSYASTDPSLIRTKSFPFSQGGLQEAAEWLDEQIGVYK